MGGGKGGSSTQTVSIPPEVLARYNAVNARAENVATTPFSPYSTSPEGFVAPLSTSQQAGIANINALQGSANQAVGAGQSLQGQGVDTARQAQGQAQGVNMAALQGISQAQQQGTAYNQAAGQNIGNAMGAAAPFMQGNAALQQQGLAQQQGYQQAATQNAANIAASAQPYLSGNAALQQQGFAQQQGYQNAATQNIGNIAASAQPYLAGNAALQQQGFAQQQGYQRAATQNAANIAASAEPYLAGNAALQQQGYAQQQAAQNAAIQNAMNIAGAGSPAQQENIGMQRAGLGQQQGYQQAATQNIGSAMASASPYMGQMAGLTQEGLGVGKQYLAGATGLTQQALQTGQQIAGQAQPYYTGALQAAQPLNQGSAQLTQNALQSAQPLNQGSAQLTQAALQSAQPLNQQAQQYMGAGAQAVGPEALNYGQYMNPFLSNVVGAQQALQAQENAAQRSAMKGKAIQSGAFGGDRAGIEQANLARQQSLANQATLSNLLQSGFNQAQQQAAQQQGVSLGAAQANRAAQQQAAQQAAALGQQQYAQNLGAAQQIGNLGQQNFAQNLGAAQQIGNLGQQNYAQTLGVGTNLAALGQQQYAQQLGAGAQIGNLGQQGFQQNLAAGAQLGQVGQNLFNQNITQGQALANLGMQGLQAMQSTGQNIGAAGMNLANLQSQQAQQMSNIGQQALQAGQSTGTNLGNIGMNRAALQGQQAEKMAALGQQGLAAAQSTGTNLGNIGMNQAALQEKQGQGLAALGQQGLAAAQSTGTNLGAIGMNQAALQGQQGQALANLGQQGLAAMQGTGTNLGNIGQQLFGQNVTQGQAIQGLGQQQFAQGLAGAQGAAAIGQNMYGQGAQTAGLEQAGGMNMANLGLQNQGAQIAGAQAQMAAGQQQQQTEQAAKTALYNQFLQQQGYPFQIAQFLGNLAMGTGSLSGSTTTATRTGYRGGRMGDGYASGGLVPPNSQGGVVYNPGAYARGGYAGGGYSGPSGSAEVRNGDYYTETEDGYRLIPPDRYKDYGIPQGGASADVSTSPAEVSPQLADAAKTNPALQQNISDYEAVKGVNKDVASAFKDSTGKDIDAASARKYQDMLNAGMSLDQVKYNIGTSQPALLKSGDVGALKGQSLAYNAENFAKPSAPVKNQFGSYAAPAPQQASGKGASQPQPQTQPYYGQPAYNYSGGYGGGYSQPTNYGMPNFGNYGGAPNYAGAAYYGGQQQYGYQPQQPQQASGKGASQPQPQPTYQAPQATGKGASQPAAQPPQASGKGMSTGGRTAYASGGRAGYALQGGVPGMPNPGDPYGTLQAQQAMFAGAPGAAAGYVPPTQVGAGQYKMLTPQASILPQEKNGLKEAVSMGTSIASLGEAGNKLYDKLAKNPTTGAVPDTFSEGMSNFGDKFKNFFGMGNAAGGRIGYNAGGIPGLDDLKQGKADIPGGEGLETPMSKVVAQGTQTPAELKGQMNSMSSGAGGLGGSGGSGIAGAIGTAASIVSLGKAAMSAGSWIGANVLPALMAFSDKRMKTDIKPIGKTFDGQTIHRYKYKGDPKTQIGLIAQEVEKKHPKAVGLAGGMKTVNYDTATREAAKRGHFADGGSAMLDLENPQDQAMAEAFDNLLQRYDNNPLLAAAAMDVGTKAVDAAIMKAEQTGGEVTDFLPRRTQEYMFALSKAALGAHDAMSREARAAGGRTGYALEGFADEPTGLAPAPSQAMTMGDVAGGLSPEPTVQVAEFKNPDILRALRGVEGANNNPEAKNPNSTAGGLYQYVDDTWRKQAPLAGVDIKQYPNARSAPAEVQHQVADANVSRILEQNKGNVQAVPHMWYSGNVEGKLSPEGLAANKGFTQEQYNQRFFNRLGTGETEQKPTQVATATGLAPKTDAGPFERTIGKAMPDSVPTDSSFWVPLIAGLGTMLASDKYRFSQRLGEGLVGGAAAYGKSQEFQQKVAENAALMGLKGQEFGLQQQKFTMEQRNQAIQIMMQLQKINLGRQMAGQPELSAEDYFKQIGASDLLSAAKAPAAAPATAPPAPAGGLRPAAAPPAAGGAGGEAPAGGLKPAPTPAAPQPAATGTAGMPTAKDPFWSTVDQQDNLPLLERNWNLAMGTGDTATANMITQNINRIKSSGMVSAGGKMVPIPGFAETQAALAAAKETATKEAGLDYVEQIGPGGEKFIFALAKKQQGATSNIPPASTGAGHVEPAGSAPQKAMMDQKTGQIKSSIPAPPPGGGYPMSKQPGATGPTYAAQRLAKNDEQFEKDFMEKTPTMDAAIERLDQMTNSFKLIHSGALADKLKGYAALAASAGQKDLAAKIMGGQIDAVAAAQLIDKNKVNLVLDTLKAATPRFAQSEFLKLSDVGSPDIAIEPMANHGMISTNKGTMEWSRQFTRDWEKAKEAGWQSPSSFFNEWSQLNPLSAFQESARRRMGTFGGMDLPPINEWTEGSVYHVPKGLKGPQAEQMGRAGLKGGDTFRFLGDRIEKVKPADLFKYGQ